jgi:hypothetical protein
LQVLPADVPPPEQAQLAQRVGQAWGQAEMQAYYAALKSRFKTEIKLPPLAPATEQP